LHSPSLRIDFHAHCPFRVIVLSCFRDLSGRNPIAHDREPLFAPITETKKLDPLGTFARQLGAQGANSEKAITKTRKYESTKRKAALACSPPSGDEVTARGDGHALKTGAKQTQHPALQPIQFSHENHWRSTSTLQRVPLHILKPVYQPTSCRMATLPTLWVLLGPPPTAQAAPAA
jgi:hypothetical protein